MALTSVGIADTVRREAAIVAPHKSFTATDQMADLGAQVAVGMPVLRDAIVAEECRCDIAMRGTSQHAIEGLQSAHMV